jgi:hypothetical protein
MDDLLLFLYCLFIQCRIFFLNTPLIRGLSNDIWALVYIFENSNYIFS